MSKRYRVEAQAQGSDVWEMIYQTDDLDKARRYAADSMLPPGAVQATRVVDQESEEVVNGNSRK
jgi:hypothetical protein